MRNCRQNGHLLGPIIQARSSRRCIFCGLEMPAEDTFQTTRSEGALEVYPAELFTQWPHHQIRAYLGLTERDLLLHNWKDRRFHVFRGNS